MPSSPPPVHLERALSTLQLSQAEARAQLCFAPDEPFFKGHFPDYPLVPGIIMIEALVLLAQRWTQSEAPIGQLHEAKFRAEARPNDVIDLRVVKQGAAFEATAEKAGVAVLTARFQLATFDAPSDAGSP